MSEEEGREDMELVRVLIRNNDFDDASKIVEDDHILTSINQVQAGEMKIDELFSMDVRSFAVNAPALERYVGK